MRFLYNVLISAAVWLVLVPAEILRAALARNGFEELRQRLGRSAPPPRKSSRRVVVHAVSVGEMAAAGALLDALLELDGEVSLLLCAGNRQALRAARLLAASRPAIEDTVLLPWDRSGALSAWLSRLEPAALVVVETEIWPNLFFACRRLGIPLSIVSARLDPRDVPRYRLLLPFFRDVLSCARWIGTQDAREAERFRSIGAAPERLAVSGNLKADITPGESLGSNRRIEELLKSRPLLVAGSTHAHEERSILRAYVSLRGEFPGLRLVLAPRHVSRISSLRRLLRRQALSCVLWSSDSNGADWDVLLVDEMGWLASLYRFADVVFVGGSLVPRGGHNLLEPAAAARAIVVGPHTENFRDIADRLERAGALARVSDDQALEIALRALFADPASRAAMGRAALSVFEETRGGSRLCAEAIAAAWRGATAGS